MSKKQSAQGLGFNSHNETSKELTRLTWRKTLKTVEVSDAWRVECAKDPNFKNKMTFVEFKREYFRKKRRK